jgi:hypothetical protein
MPQALLLAVIGTGLYAGLKWMARTLEEQAATAQRQAEELSRRAAASRGGEPRDLGRLEWDDSEGVYRPRP